jgi:hypothetical protein
MFNLVPDIAQLIPALIGAWLAWWTHRRCKHIINNTTMKNQLNTFTCKHCGKSVRRKSTKMWIKSFCQKLGKVVHIYRKK